jgi:hypothetical protein
VGQGIGQTKPVQMPAIKVRITRFVDEDQPGFVECQFVDAKNHTWTFIEKAPILTAEDLWSDSGYPRDGVIECEVIQRSADEGGELVTVDTERSAGVESTDGTTRFEIRSDILVE